MKTLTTLLAIFVTLSVQAQQSLNEFYDGTQPLTQEQSVEAANYVHQGILQKTLDEECKKLSNGCGANSVEAGHVLKGTAGAAVEEIIPKLYTTLFGLGGIGQIKMAVKDQAGLKKGANAPEAKPDAKGKTEKEYESKEDMCIKIPMVMEIGAGVLQALTEKNIVQQTTNEIDKQRESLYSVKRIHEARRKTALIQGGIYAAAEACYVGYIVAGAKVDPAMILKLGATAGLSVLYFKKAKNHKEYANLIQGVIDKLPGVGKCNPHTQTQCFCAEATSQAADATNYQKYCMPREYANRNEKNPLPCTTIGADGKTIVDNDCKCKKTNSCFSHQIQGQLSSIGFTPTYINDNMAGLRALDGGDFEEGKIDQFGKTSNAIANKILAKHADLIPSVTLDKNKKKLADEMIKNGVDNRIASIAATQAGSGPALSSVGAPASSGSSANFANGTNGVKAIDVDYEQGKGTTTSRRRGGSDDSDNPFFKSGNSASKGGSSSVEIETFAERATESAEINKNSDNLIFDQISNRYKKSGWSRFDMDKLIKEQEAFENN